MKTKGPIQEALKRRDFETAAKLIDEELRTNPKSANAHYLRGVSFYFQGKLKASRDALTQALNFDPKHTDAAVCLSVLYNDMGFYDEAKKVFHTANHSILHQQAGDDTQVDKKFSVKHLELGDLYFRHRRYDEAIEEYTKAAHLDPGVLEIRIRRAKAYAKKGFVTRAIQELQLLKREFPERSAVMIQLGLLHFSQGNSLDAELEWESALEADPGNREAANLLEMSQDPQHAFQLNQITP